jgi:hypothetical protein
MCSTTPLIHPQVHAVATSSMMVAARQIAATAKELVSLLHDFNDRFNETSILRAVRRAGVHDGNDHYLQQTAAYLLADCRGFTWTIEMFESVISGEILKEDAGILDR